MNDQQTQSSERVALRGAVICGDCRTVHYMGNGLTCAADKPGHSHLYSHCPTCGHKTWSEPFVMRSMTKAEIAAALSQKPKEPKDEADWKDGIHNEENGEIAYYTRERRFVLRTTQDAVGWKPVWVFESMRPNVRVKGKP